MYNTEEEKKNKCHRMVGFRQHPFRHNNFLILVCLWHYLCCCLSLFRNEQKKNTDCACHLTTFRKSFSLQFLWHLIIRKSFWFVISFHFHSAHTVQNHCLRATWWKFIINNILRWFLSDEFSSRFIHCMRPVVVIQLQ